MSDSKSILRQITIKTGVVKRLIKEEKSYILEAKEQEKRVAEFESNPDKEDWQTSQQKKVLQDCLQMIPDCKKRLEVSIEDLKNILQDVPSEIESSNEIISAKEVLNQAEESLS